MRVQNEGTGKSSWWMINPDAKPGKAARRRATSMETHKYEKKRGRVKKRVEALRNGLIIDQASPSSSISEGIDIIPGSPLHYSFTNLASPDGGFIGSSGIGSGRASSLAGGLNGVGGIFEGNIDLPFTSPMDMRDSGGGSGCSVGTGSDTNEGQMMDQTPTPPHSVGQQTQPSQQEPPSTLPHPPHATLVAAFHQPSITNGHHIQPIFSIGPNSHLNHNHTQPPPPPPPTTTTTTTQPQGQGSQTPPQQQPPTPQSQTPNQPPPQILSQNHLSQHNQFNSFTLATDDFRPRASSNASSCGRLSPIMVKDFLDNIFNDN